MTTKNEVGELLETQESEKEENENLLETNDTDIQHDENLIDEDFGVIKVFRYRGFDWHLHYTEERIELIEMKTGLPFMTVGIYNGLMSISILKQYFAYGLCNEHGDYITVEHGLQCAKEQLREIGYGRLNGAVISQIREDCGFLFQID